MRMKLGKEIDAKNSCILIPVLYQAKQSYLCNKLSPHLSLVGYTMELDVLLEEKSKELKNLQEQKIKALNDEIGYVIIYI